MTADMIWKVVTAVLLPIAGWLLIDHLRLRDRIAGLEVKIAETYATNAYVREVEERLGGTLRNIDSKLDRLVEKLLEKD